MSKISWAASASNILDNFKILRANIITKYRVQFMLLFVYNTRQILLLLSSISYPSSWLHSMTIIADSQVSLKLRFETFKQWSAFSSSVTPHKSVLLLIFVGFCTLTYNLVEMPTFVHTLNNTEKCPPSQLLHLPYLETVISTCRNFREWVIFQYLR